MTISGFTLITLVLFMVHEFEEIIFVRRYIDKHADNNRYHDELFVAGRDHYPSTAAIAASFQVSSVCDQPERIFTVTGTATPVCSTASLTALTTA